MHARPAAGRVFVMLNFRSVSLFPPGWIVPPCELAWLAQSQWVSLQSLHGQAQEKRPWIGHVSAKRPATAIVDAC